MINTNFYGNFADTSTITAYLVPYIREGYVVIYTLAHGITIRYI